MEICFSGQLDEIYPYDVDFFLEIKVIEFTNTKGNFSPRAVDPSEYYGDQYLEWEILKAQIVRNNTLCGTLSERETELLRAKYEGTLDDLVWDACLQDKDMGELE